jgi:hypothetical protein
VRRGRFRRILGASARRQARIEDLARPRKLTVKASRAIAFRSVAWRCEHTKQNRLSRPSGIAMCFGARSGVPSSSSVPTRTSGATWNTLSHTGSPAASRTRPAGSSVVAIASIVLLGDYRDERGATDPPYGELRIDAVRSRLFAGRRETPPALAVAHADQRIH